jgi:2-polyprenyl-3-methyl-5-hydroxy-6-metoxy-1,4-benzoquinol methylase
LTCTFCGGTLVTENKIGKFNLSITYHVCLDCKTGFLDQKFQTESKPYYTGDYEKWFYQQASQLTPIKHAFSDAAARVFLLAHFLKLKGASVLDIGCGIAGTVKLLSLVGANAEGLEPSVPQTKFDVEKLGLKVQQGFLQDIHPSKTYDLITMFDVIEHVEDPVKEMKKIRELLKPNGSFFFTTPHNKKASQSIIFQQSHLYLFSLASIASLLAKAGFRIDKVLLLGGSLNIFAVPVSQSEEPHSFPSKFLEDYSKKERRLLGEKYLVPIFLRWPRLAWYFYLSMREFGKIKKLLAVSK